MWFQSWVLLVVCLTVCVVSELGSVSCVSDGLCVWFQSWVLLVVCRTVCVVSELGSVSLVSDCACGFRAGLC